MKTYLAKKNEVKQNWWLLNAEGQILGRIASQAAAILRGKTKPEFTPNVDTGDFLVVVNVEKIKISGKKELKKSYKRHSGIPGGFKSVSVEKQRQKNPLKILGNAVRGMLPHTTLGEKQFKKLKLYSGQAHPHKSQNPKELKLTFASSNK
jgi:large subunit ribosomal protein L13